jgi:hypothetical protein
VNVRVCAYVCVDDNPIELGFNSLKAWLKRRRAGESSDPVLQCIRGLRYYSTGAAAAGWFRKRGYMVPLPAVVDAEVTAMMAAAAAFTVVVAVASQHKASWDEMMLR